MERLTFEGNFCDIAQCEATPGGSFCEDGACDAKKVWERLKEYEDSGYTPAVISMIGRLDQALERRGTRPERLFELMEADKEGRVAILPCEATPDWQLEREQKRVEFWKRQCEERLLLRARVGDTLYLTASHYNSRPPEPIAARVTRITIDAGDRITYVTDKRRIGAEELGTTVFRDREEAEKALEDRRNRADC